jgi:hypothetical protein
VSLKSREVRKLAAAGAVAAAMLGSAASAQAATATLNYSCVYPLIGAQPLSIAINADIPSSVPANGPSGVFDIKATATASGNTPSGINILGAKTLEGTGRATATLNAPGVTGLALRVPITIAQQTVPGTTANLKILATGSTPSIFLPTAGAANVTVQDLTLNLTAKDASGNAIPLGSATDSDSNPDTFDVNCTQVAGQNQTLANFTVSDPGTAAATPPASVQPAAPAAAPWTAQSTGIDYNYGLAGSATLKTLIQGVLPLSGSIGAHLSLPTGAFTGDLTLAPASGGLKALGILPVTAAVALVPTGPVTGTLANGVLKAVAKVNIKLTSVKLAGIPLVNGPTCRALNVSTINLQSTDKFFYPLSGGTLAGAFTISNLVGCGPLNGLVSPLAAGGGNAIALKLTPAV